MRTKNVYVGNQRVVSVLNPDEQTRYEYYYHTDHLGSTTYLTDRDGKLKEHIEYTPWGEGWIEQPTNRYDLPQYLFTGKELDATGLYYYGARYYDPRISMWLSADPVVGKYIDDGIKWMREMDGDEMVISREAAGVFDGKNMALYTYCHQNPIILVDPDGNKTWPIASTIIRTELYNAFIGYYNAPRPGNRDKLHHGVDISGNIGDPVTATDTGIVVFAGYANKKLGNIVRIETLVINEDGTFNISISEVAHLNDIFVQTGDIVEEGVVVGTLGQTGNAGNTSPHVHYSEKNSKGVFKNPSSTYTAEERKQQSIPETDYNKIGNNNDN